MWLICSSSSIAQAYVHMPHTQIVEPCYLSNRSQHIWSINEYEWVWSCCYKLWCPSRICFRTPAIFITYKQSELSNKILCLNNSIKKLNKLVNADLRILTGKSTLKLNSSTYEKYKYGHLGCWCIKLQTCQVWFMQNLEMF